jgi:hypothetical protein
LLEEGVALDMALQFGIGDLQPEALPGLEEQGLFNELAQRHLPGIESEGDALGIPDTDSAIPDGTLTAADLSHIADAQFVRTFGTNSLTVGATWIHETQALNASFASGAAVAASHHLDTYRARGTYRYGQLGALSVAPFLTTGDADALLYASAAVTGSASGRPNSSGIVAQADLMPWQNVRLSAQYTAYTKFNGGTSNYDGSGRNASHNNTLYLSLWLMY